MSDSGLESWNDWGALQTMALGQQPAPVASAPQGYDPQQSLQVNLQNAGLGSISPQFLSVIETAFAKAGAQGYGGEQAFNLIKNADQNQINSNPFAYANQLLQQSGIPGFSSTQEWQAAN